MFRLQQIATVFTLALFFAATTGIPVSIHLCCGEPVATACSPDECCADESANSGSEEEPCCTELVSVDSLKDFSIAAPAVGIPNLLVAFNNFASYDHQPTPLVQRHLALTAGAEHPHAPPDLVALCQLLI